MKALKEEIVIKLKRSFIAVIALLVFFLNGCGKEINYNAAVAGGVYKEDFLKENKTSGAYYKNENYDPEDENSDEYVLDEKSPRSRTFVITGQSQLDEIFESFSTPIDFEKQMLVVYVYTDCYLRTQILKSVKLSDNVLKIKFKIESGEPGHGDARKPYQRTFAVMLDKLNVEAVEIALAS